MRKPLLPQWILVFLIGVTMSIFSVSVIEFFYSAPEIALFCEDTQVRIVPKTEKECRALGGEWVPERFVQESLPEPGQLDPPVITKEHEGYCDTEHTCVQSFEEARSQYERNIFFLLLVIAAGVFFGVRMLRKYERIAAAFLFGGVLMVGVSIVRYWPLMDELFRVLVLGSTLVALLWAGIGSSSERAHRHE